MQTPRDFKYVIIDKVYPIIFTEANSHDAFSKIGKITSAGYASLHVTSLPNGLAYVEVATFGESVSLKLKPDPADADLLTALFVKTY